MAVLPVIGLPSLVKATPETFPISCNDYNWRTFFSRQNKDWGIDVAADIAEFSKSGLKAIEPNITDSAAALRMIEVLKKYNIKMPSIYVNSVLHDKDEIEKSIETILQIADVVKNYGTKIVVTNPSPIKWGGKEIKNDAQLMIQAQAMEKLGSELRRKGLKLAYHTHDVELRAGAREFHHVLLNTSPQNVYFCFDIHWVYRGSENSELAVFDVLKLYGKRIIELHIRQSKNGVWSEIFTPEGDIDYRRLANEMKKNKIFPHLVIEQCVEAQSPNTVDAVAAHKQDLAAIKTTFNKV